MLVISRSGALNHRRRHGHAGLRAIGPIDEGHKSTKGGHASALKTSFNRDLCDQVRGIPPDFVSLALAHYFVDLLLCHVSTVRRMCLRSTSELDLSRAVIGHF